MLEKVFYEKYKQKLTEVVEETEKKQEVREELYEAIENLQK
tara:strand:- start:461 stop:583 length:123 start_codon:yes stop_codon:yes gene_type:complete